LGNLLVKISSFTDKKSEAKPPKVKMDGNYQQNFIPSSLSLRQ